MLLDRFSPKTPFKLPQNASITTPRTPIPPNKSGEREESFGRGPGAGGALFGAVFEDFVISDFVANPGFSGFLVGIFGKLGGGQEVG
mgnify:CR=1 FL=1